MKAFHYLITTLMMAMYGCLAMAFSSPATEADSLPYDPMPQDNQSIECQYSTPNTNDLPAMRTEDWHQVNRHLRTRMEHQRQTWQQRIIIGIRTAISQSAQKYNMAVKVCLQSSDHFFRPSLEPPCKYYVFAMRHILA